MVKAKIPGAMRSVSEDGQEGEADLEQQLAALLPEGMKDPDDPRRELLRYVGDKWSVLVLMILTTGTYRHAALRRGINAMAEGAEISQPVLTDVLRKFERNGLLDRRVIREKPLAVDYALTELGLEFAHKLVDLVDWAGDHLQRIEAARTRFAGSSIR